MSSKRAHSGEKRRAIVGQLHLVAVSYGVIPSKRSSITRSSRTGYSLPSKVLDEDRLAQSAEEGFAIGAETVECFVRRDRAQVEVGVPVGLAAGVRASQKCGNDASVVAAGGDKAVENGAVPGEAAYVLSKTECLTQFQRDIGTDGSPLSSLTKYQVSDDIGFACRIAWCKPYYLRWTLG